MKISPPKPTVSHPLYTGGELVLRGIPASPGISIGRVHLLVPETPVVQPRKIAPGEVPGELVKFEQALTATAAAIERSKDRALSVAGIAAAKIFDAHLLILDDVVFQDDVRARVTREQFCVDYIVNDVLGHAIDVMDKTEGELFRERAADIRDVRNRLLRFISGKGDVMPEAPAEPVVLVAHDLSPTDTLHLDRHLIEAIAADTGGLTSHTAILARSLDIPAVVGVTDLSWRVKAGDQIVLNGNSGKVIVHPSESTLEEYRAKQQRYRAFVSSLENLKDLPAQTADGHEVQLWGNIELPYEAESVLGHGGTGVGLFRSEFMFLTRETVPTENEQFDTYDRAAEILAPRPLVIRTFDLGGDKLHGSINLKEEKNPFLGYRAIRVSLTRRDLFRAQLRAILRASSRGNVRIMFPFISGLEELREAKAVVAEASAELDRLRIPHDPQLKIGIMVEIPSAVVIADHLAEESDFFSIGTNDLTQYTVAADRGNDMVSNYYRSFHPAVLRLIQQTIRAGHKAKIPVAICGEFGANPVAAPLLLGLGIDEISTNATAIPEIKKTIRTLSMADCRKIATRALRMKTAAEIQTYLSGELKSRLADLPIWFT
ncbi:phosphoenolpyruvate--protein phosphotransferase [candidate division KSB1 bacterium]|nr:phosphoenolpyruvate--protein phosphotransferase [candidate division KSB1 bacterium]